MVLPTSWLSSSRRPALRPVVSGGGGAIVSLARLPGRLAFALVLWSGLWCTAIALGAGTPPKADLDQARNGAANSPISPVDYQNGNAGSSNSHYIEGHSIAYRLYLTNLTTSAPADTHSVVIEWDIKHSSRNSIDYITRVDRLQPHTQFLPSHGQEAVDPLEGLLESFSGPTMFAIPTPPVSVLVGGVPQPTTSFGNLGSAEREMWIYNGTITYLKYVRNADGNFGDLGAAQSATRLRVGFTATSPSVVIAWGGHIGTMVDWGAGNSAGGISGSPYHTRLIALDGSGGNQDRSLSAAAVLTCGVDGPGSPCRGTTQTYTSTSNVENGSYIWTLTNNTSGASIVGSATGSSVNVSTGTGGTFTVNVQITSNQGGVTCEKTVTVNPGPVCSIGGASTVCPGTTDNSHCGPVGMASYAWSISGDGTIPGPTNGQCVAVNAGSACNGAYVLTLTITDASGCPSTCQKTVTVVDTSDPTVSGQGPGGTLECPLTPTFTPPSAQDTCDPSPVVSVLSDVTVPGACAGAYTRTIRWVATDACGNVSDPVSETWTVLDTTAPTVTCPSNLTAGCSEVVNFTTDVTDACDPNVTVTCDPPSGQVFPAGETTVTCSSTDACGNTRTCSFTVTVAPCAEGCTPGFWCGGVGRTLWSEPGDPQWSIACGATVPFLMTDTFCGAPLNLFDCHPDVQDSTMSALLCTGGGNIPAQKAARDVIAAYLNASCNGVAFGMTPQAVAQMWNDAVAGTISFETVHTTLGALNDPQTLAACPLGRVRTAVVVRREAEGVSGTEAPVDDRSALELYRPTPNPFRDATRLAYVVTEAKGERVEIGVYDISGRRIRGLVDEITNPGRYETRWDGFSDAGLRVTNGLYFIHLSVGQRRRTVHVVYLR